MPVPLIEADALELRFGRRAVLSDVSLTVARGQVHGLLGPRGAGKSVLLRVLAGELAPTGGAARAADPVLVTEDSPLRLARAMSGAPSVVLIDEPPAGFAPDTCAAVRALVQRHTARGGAAVWSTPRLDTLHPIASGVTLLAGGHVRYSGSVEALMLRSLARPAEAFADAA